MLPVYQNTDRMLQVIKGSAMTRDLQNTWATLSDEQGTPLQR